MLLLSLALVVILFDGLVGASPPPDFQQDFIIADNSPLPPGYLKTAAPPPLIHTSADLSSGKGVIPCKKVEARYRVETWKGDQRYQADPKVRSWLVDQENSASFCGGDSRAFDNRQEGDPSHSLFRDQPPPLPFLLQPIWIISTITH